MKYLSVLLLAAAAFQFCTASKLAAQVTEPVISTVKKTDSIPAPKSDSLPGKGNRFVHKIEKLFQPKKPVKPKKLAVIVLPIATSSPETSVGAGFATSTTFKTAKGDTSLRTSNLQTLVLYTARRQIVTGIDGTIYFPREKYILHFIPSFSNFPDHFWGYGNNTPESADEAYTFTQFSFDAKLYRKIFTDLFIAAQVDYQYSYHIEYIQGGIFDKENVLGRYGGSDLGLGFVVAYDTRNDAFAPTKGGFAQFDFLNISKEFGSNFAYNSYEIDLRKFFKTFGQQVLAMQFDGTAIYGGPPIRSINELGGSNILRGYYQGRYRDKVMASAQVEYRFPIFGRFGGAVFIGTGQVSDKIDHLKGDGFKLAEGGGIRFRLQKSERLNIRFDYAVGHNTSGIYVTVGEAF